MWMLAPWLNFVTPQALVCTVIVLAIFGVVLYILWRVQRLNDYQYRVWKNDLHENLAGESQHDSDEHGSASHWAICQDSNQSDKQN